MARDRTEAEGPTIRLCVLLCRLNRRVAAVQPKQIDINQNGMYIAPNKHKNIKYY